MEGFSEQVSRHTHPSPPPHRPPRPPPTTPPPGELCSEEFAPTLRGLRLCPWDQDDPGGAVGGPREEEVGVCVGEGGP